MPSIIMALHRKFRPYNIFGTHFKICAEQVESQMYEIEKKDPGQKRTKDGHVEYCIKWKGFTP